MAEKIVVVNQLRPKIQSQGVVDIEELARRIARQSTTFDEDEMFGIFRKAMREMLAALQNGETVKLDGVLTISVNMKVGGEVGLIVRGNRSAIASLQNPALWTAVKVSNHANLHKSSEELIAEWNAVHPEDPVDD
ncbi:MAG: hypothetical protein H6662_00055 [Ardenticatenaceae bacterium]|nr:hypothetical protein [Anaerolineales bacterium]MCB8919947.1 hypothetical protein [Ardenticatenaceae bacterium]MCB8989794.1 hypothetical protein [Ardenticatenaceae bacterium]MCB9003970.1 hypothetical protein [Ardenticatenaceae bacterium]